jgi:hypothetical protein
MTAMTRAKQARIALGVIALANVALILATLPRPSRLSEWLALIVCSSTMLLAYRESPADFHRSVSAKEAARILLTLFVGLGVLISVQLLLR